MIINEVKSKKKTPCKECPFRKNNSLTGDKPGGSDVSIYIGQAQGPFWLPCHLEKGYHGVNSNTGEVNQCAGAAIFRANVAHLLGRKLPESLMFLESNTELVFSDFYELYSHYKKVSIDEAKEILTPKELQKLLIEELEKVTKKQYYYG